ncbi:aromatic ring-hydroxylating dioxygenase subunit alpha [Pseudofrankia sp. BMG5.36]|uniref:aromatic ring-hydroxylating oxygenase subunit alpha n=1 Tax=Pseudofrankia sp. BMG5.36 TaxID=1834512 RepID=UPI0008D8F8FE|nr:aromatic ring-hydroxylating dioxygenase subunit alpha [Pseudofrankia sp. BMG5.36]OHV46704.1 hypothetical protein BCD48_20710 [Pseudofrankia sp. BMG5.36]
MTISLDERVLDRAAEILGDIEHCADPIATARLLPREVYTSQEFWQFEKEAIFAREWLCVGHVGEVPEPGNHLPLKVLDEPLIMVRGGAKMAEPRAAADPSADMVRGAAGDVYVLSAICQHRGHAIFDGLGAREAAAPCLPGGRLVCPYHNWQYELDGSLVAAPSMRETVPLERLRAEIRLPRIRTEVFHGLVFVTFDPDAAPLAPTLAKLDEELSTFGLDELVPMPATLREGLTWNWKLHHDNALEPYHTGYVHKDAHDAAPSRLARFGVFDPGDGQVMHPTYLKSEELSLGNDGERMTTFIPGLTDEQRRRVMFASVPPLLFGIFQPTFASMSFLLPTGPGTIDLRRVDLYPKAAVEQPGFADAYAAQVTRKAVAIHQDEETTRALHRGYASRHAPRGPLSWLESTIPQLNQWLLERYLRVLDKARPAGGGPVGVDAGA